LLLLAPFLTPLTPNPAVAGEIAHTVRLAPGAVDVSGGAVAITDRESHVLRDEGMPALPYLIVNVLLPADERVASHTITETGVAEIAAAFAPPVAPPLLNSEGVAAPPSSLASWSGDGRSFPSVAARYLGTGLLHGRAIASFAVFPVRLHDGSLSSAASIEIRVRTRPASQEEKAVRCLRPRPELDEAVRDRLAHVVVNPEGASAGGSAAAEKRPGGFRPTTFPSLEGSPVDYVIVTTDSLAEKYQRLADFKTVKGVPTVVRTTEWIEANYVNGVDIQETIRTFVIDAYQKWGITYLLLGGDTDQLPARLGASLFLGERIVPVDMYFGCLDGDWNADHDDRFGEPGPTADAPDLRQEVYVGRLPTSTRAEVDLLVDKVIAYESTADAAFTGRVMELAEVLFPLDWTAGEPTTIDGAALAEFVYLQSFTGTPLSVDRKYENYPVFPGSTEETVALSIAALNDGQNHVNHVGHGFRFNMSVGNGSIQNSDADALTNGSPASNFYLLNCTVLAYTYYCLAEHFLRNPNGGAVSCIGANESAFPLASQPYMNEYFWLVFNLDVVNIGEAFVRSRLPRVAIAELGDNARRPSRRRGDGPCGDRRQRQRRGRPGGRRARVPLQGYGRLRDRDDGRGGKRVAPVHRGVAGRRDHRRHGAQPRPLREHDRRDAGQLCVRELGGGGVGRYRERDGGQRRRGARRRGNGCREGRRPQRGRRRVGQRLLAVAQQHAWRDRRR
jgi:hypothetical protein